MGIVRQFEVQAYSAWELALWLSTPQWSVRLQIIDTNLTLSKLIFSYIATL
jgi:hypothetical protein